MSQIKGLVAAEMAVKARVVSVHGASGYSDRLQRVTLRVASGDHPSRDIVVINRAGWQLDQELIATFKPAPEPTEQPPY